MNVISAQLEKRKRMGGWLTENESMLASFRDEIANRTKVCQLELFPVIRDLEAFINANPIIRMYFTQAIEQAVKAGFHLGYENINELICCINEIMIYAPPFSTSELVGCPLNALLDWLMCMPAGFALFRLPELNIQLKRVLNFWCHFLKSPQSRTYLNETQPDGWFNPDAIPRTLMPQFVCDPTAPYWGFSSWNDFFTRRFKEGERPIAEPDNTKVIVNPCESTPYNIKYNVKLQDNFWIKTQPYSLQDIFSIYGIHWARQFNGGMIYQAFLSAYNYHRWHSPVSGTLVDAYHVDGTYYSDATSEGVDPAGPNDSQGYISSVASRVVLIIQCHDPVIQTVACVFVGMGEISSCIIERKIGEYIQKGEELGYFQYGGSTYCIIFKAGVIRSFVPKMPFKPDAAPIPVNSHLATAN